VVWSISGRYWGEGDAYPVKSVALISAVLLSWFVYLESIMQPTVHHMITLVGLSMHARAARASDTYSETESETDAFTGTPVSRSLLGTLLSSFPSRRSLRLELVSRVPNNGT